MSEPETPLSDDAEMDAETAKAVNRFDIRRLIGGLFALYGIVLVVTGAAGDHVVKSKAAGINVDLYTGLAMIVVAIGMIAWALLRPVVPDARRP